MKLTTILTAIKCLISAENAAEYGGDLEQRLHTNLKSFHSLLKRPGPENEELQQTTAAIKEEHDLFGHGVDSGHTKDCETVYWTFAVEGLCLLQLLNSMLKTLAKEDERSTATSSKLPAAPKCLLSIADLKTVRSLLQFIVSLGIYPYLLPGIDTYLKMRLGHAQSLPKARTLPNMVKNWHLYRCCRILIECFENPLFGASVLSQHFCDVLAACLQVCYGPMEHRDPVTTPSGDESKDEQRTESEVRYPLTPADIATAKQNTASSEVCRHISAAEKEHCIQELWTLLSRVDQPLVVRELLVLQGMPQSVSRRPASQARQRGHGVSPGVALESGARWLQTACGQLLSERLMQEDGVQNVLRGIFEATSTSGGTGAGDWRKCQSVARIIASCPSQATSVEEYYSLVGPQVLALLHLPEEGTGHQFLRVAVATIAAMLSQQQLLAERYLLEPILQPLRQLAGDVPFSEHEMQSFGTVAQLCIEDLHKICGVVEPSSPLGTALRPYLPLLFEIWRVCSSRASQSKDDVKEVLLRLLQPADTAVAVSLFKVLVHMPLLSGDCKSGRSFKRAEPTLALSCNDHSGVVVERLTKGEWFKMYSVERMENTANCILDLLKSGLKSSILGILFTECLLHLAMVLCRTIGYDASATAVGERAKETTEAHLGSKQQEVARDTNSDLLECESNPASPSQSEAYGNALVLYLMAALCEQMSGEVLEQVELRKLIEVVSVVVNCHAHFVSGRSSSLLLVAGPDLEELLGGSITLSVMFGLLSAILSGAREVELRDRPLLSGLLPALEMLATRYPDQELCKLADDLRVCIATLGAVWSVEMREKAATIGGAGLTGRTKSTAAQQLLETPSGKGERTRVNLVEDLQGEHVAPLLQEIEKADVRKTKSPSDAHPKKEVSEPVETSTSCSSDEASLHQALQDLKDPLVPVQGHGLITLTRLIEKKDPETLANSSELLAIFTASLSHSDSYIYLAAITGLVALAHVLPMEVIPTICQQYAQLPDQPSREKRLNFNLETGQLRTSKSEQSLKSGQQRTTESDQHRTLISQTLESSNGTESLSRTTDLRMKLGEALVKVARDCGETLPHYADSILAAVLSNARDPNPLIRASSLSNLADICALLRFSFGTVQNEVLSCLTHVLQSEGDPRVRRAALLALKLIIKGLSQDALQVLGPSLLEIYRLLKHVEATESTGLTREHTQACLGELDIIMRGFLFPQPALAKNISVLGNT